MSLSLSRISSAVWKATITGTLAARQAGKKPLIKPIMSAMLIPLINRSGLSWKLNTTWVKLPPKVEALRPSKKIKAANEPTILPMAAKVIASAMVPIKAEKWLKPMALKVAISIALSDTEVYMVFKAPANAPRAMIELITQPNMAM